MTINIFDLEENVIIFNIIEFLPINNMFLFGKTCKKFHYLYNLSILNNKIIKNYIMFDNTEHFINLLLNSHISKDFDKIIPYNFSPSKIDTDNIKIRNTFKILCYLYDLKFLSNNIIFQLQIYYTNVLQSIINCKNVKTTNKIFHKLIHKKNINIFRFDYDLFDIYKILYYIINYKHIDILNTLKNIQMIKNISINSFNNTMKNFIEFIDTINNIDFNINISKKLSIKIIFTSLIYKYLLDNISFLRKKKYYNFAITSLKKGEQLCEEINDIINHVSVPMYISYYIITNINICCKQMYIITPTASVP